MGSASIDVIVGLHAKTLGPAIHRDRQARTARPAMQMSPQRASGQQNQWEIRIVGLWGVATKLATRSEGCQTQCCPLSPDRWRPPDPAASNGHSQAPIAAKDVKAKKGHLAVTRPADRRFAAAADPIATAGIFTGEKSRLRFRELWHHLDPPHPKQEL